MKDDKLPPPITKKSTRKELWDELCAARDEIDQQQRVINELMSKLDSEKSASKRLQERLAGAHMRLDVIRAAAQVVALEPEGPDGHGVNWLAGKRPKPGDLLYGGDAVARALAAKNEADTRELKAAQETDELRASIRQALGFAECSGGPNQMPNVVETLRRALGPNAKVTCRGGADE